MITGRVPESPDDSEHHELKRFRQKVLKCIENRTILDVVPAIYSKSCVLPSLKVFTTFGTRRLPGWEGYERAAG